MGITTHTEHAAFLAAAPVDREWVALSFNGEAAPDTLTIRMTAEQWEQLRAIVLAGLQEYER